MTQTRREFVKTTAAAGLATAAFSSTGSALGVSETTARVAVVGCGGRASYADLPNFVKACEILGIKHEIVLLADAFEDQAKKLADKMEVGHSKCVWGFDSYRKVAESNADYVIIAAPPLFRPLHLEAMVEAGKHVMFEKPVAVDAPGCRKVIEVGETAKKKKLSLVTGTQRRHDVKYLTQAAQIEAGAIGQILGGAVMWNGKVPWIWERQPGWSDADYLARNWLNWSEMSADHIGEQHIHNLDVANWFIGRVPVSAVGFGGRARRITGNMYDFFSVDLDYGDGVHIHSQCRQISGTHQRVGEFLRGTHGSVWGGGKLEGKEVAIPEIHVDDEDSSVQEMVDWVRSVINGDPLNQARQIAESNAVAVMARYAAYTGQLVRYIDLMENPNSDWYDYKVSVQPEQFETATVRLPKENVVPIPGDDEPIRRKS